MNAVSIVFVCYLFFVLHKAHACDQMLPVGSPFNKTNQPVPVLLEKALPVSRYARSALAGRKFKTNMRKQ